MTISYEIKDKDIHVNWKVENTDSVTIPFTIGGHPAFMFKEGDAKTDYVLKFPGKKQLDYILLDKETGTALPDKVYQLELEDETCPLNDEMFENDALVFDNTQIEEVWLCYKDGRKRVGMLAKDFPNYGIWSVKDAPFVCLEPWVGRCDNYGFDKELATKPGIFPPFSFINCNIFSASSSICKYDFFLRAKSSLPSGRTLLTLASTSIPT